MKAPSSPLYEARLAASGLTMADAKTLQLKFLSPMETANVDAGFPARPSIEIPYLDPLNPSKSLSGWPGWHPFSRYRLLGDPPPSLNDLTKQKPRRYLQAGGSGVCAYFSPLGTDWDRALKDTSEAIIITEGEFKAIKACKEGFPTIGLGGVWNFRSAALGIPFLPELEAVNWIGKTVYIAYDSDMSTKPNIVAAIWDMANEIMARGGMPHVTKIPDLVEEGKTGLDDFLLTQPADQLSDVLIKSQPITLAKALWAINKEVVYVRNPGLIVIRKNHQKMSPEAFKGHAFIARTYMEQVIKDDGSIALKPAPAPTAWMKWALRTEVEKLTYQPGAPALMESGDWNLWPGWGCEPRKGDVAPFLALIDHLFTDADKGAKDWFLDWSAYPLQNPGAKMPTTAVLQGRTHGTGKSLVGETYGKIYGENFSSINQGNLHSSFTGWAENKQFILADEVTGSAARKDADMLKLMISRTRMEVNVKFVPSYFVPDLSNWFFVTNHPDAFFLEDTDRRYFIHEVVVGPLADQFYIDYGAWLAGDGPAALFHWLLKRNLSKFNPFSAAFSTLAKARLLADTRSDLGVWVRSLVKDPERYLMAGDVPLPPCDLYTARQLLLIFDPLGNKNLTVNGLSRELRRVGCAMANHGQPVPGHDGKSERYYILKNVDKWVRARASDVVKYLFETGGF